MSFVDARNKHGEIQAVPEHFLVDFSDQFKPITPAKIIPAKADNPKES